MLTISLYSATAFVVIAGVLITVTRQRAKKIIEARQALGILWLKQLRVILSKAQKHRGLSSGYLNGDQSSLSELNRLQTGINRDIQDIQALGEWMKKNERWKVITEHWGRLSKRFKDLDPANNMNQHNVMIQNILYLIEDMADEHSLIRLTGTSRRSVEFLWKDLLQTIEYMGQARAIGTGVAARGKCGSVERIKLNYLHKKIERGASLVLGDLPESVIAQREVSALLEYIDTKILGSACAISPADYFAAATKALESLYSQYDLTVNKLSPAH